MFTEEDINNFYSVGFNPTIDLDLNSIIGRMYNQEPTNNDPNYALQGGIMLDPNFDFNSINDADIYEKDGKVYSSNPYVDRIIQIESGRNPRAYNKSGASGAFQFIKSTAKQYGLNNPFNAQESLNAYKKLTMNNIRQMQRYGIPINPTTVYLAHQQGVGGLKKIVDSLNNGTPLDSTTLRNVKNNSLGGYRGLQTYFDDWKKRVEG